MPISSALGSSALLPAGLGFRNVVINGDMAIDQRNAGAAATLASAGYVWPVDRFKFYQAAASKITGQRVAKSASASNAPEGFQYSLKLTNAASGTAPAAGDEYQLYHIVEGSSLDTWDWGYSTAKPVVLSFWVRSSVTGTYAISLYNAGTANRSYVTTYTVSAADTWEKKTIYVNGDTTGTWTIGASNGIGIIWDLGSGSNLNATPNAWAGAFDTRTSGSITWISTANATFYITGVQLEQNYQPTPFEQRPYGVELQLCQRYYYRHVTGTGKNVYFGVYYSANGFQGLLTLPVTMRATPTIDYAQGTNYYTILGANTDTSSYIFFDSYSTNTMVALYDNATASGTAGQAGFVITASASAYLGFSSEL